MLVNLNNEDIQKIAQIFRDETGNQVQEKNHSMLESRMRTHILKLGLKSMPEYWKHFSANEKVEREALQSLMTTHYTFFFREYTHFEALDKWLNEESSRLKQRWESKKIPVQIWSAACSRGQEVYSLAMFLEEKLLKKHGIAYQIVGTDIDSESVAYAKNGVYPLREANTIPQAYLNIYWKKGAGQIKDFAAIHPNLKARTSFESLNLLELPEWSNKQTYDVIFCRNVFIYFSDEHVKKIALDLNKRLGDGGLFISGVSEPMRFDGWTLSSVGPSCYKKGAVAVAAVPKPAAAPSVSKSAPMTLAVPEKSPAISAKYHVLCVDDSPTIQLLIKKIFSSDPECASVDIAINGRDAREKLDAKKYDVVTLDIHMPEVNGIEFLEKLYKRKTDPPVLMVSSVNRTDVELATKSLALGAFDYVEKPAMNNLQKSTEEILTKASMARRSKATVSDEPGSFDAAIGQKIIVPDASLCLRAVFAADEDILALEQVVSGQKGEHRSPAMLVVWREGQSTSIEGHLLKWTDRKMVTLRDGKQLLKPNHIYLLKRELLESAMADMQLRTTSVQILDSKATGIKLFKKSTTLQILVNEKLGHLVPEIERTNEIKVSDITPATSFPSLSVEFFANLRKAA